MKNLRKRPGNCLDSRRETDRKDQETYEESQKETGKLRETALTVAGKQTGKLRETNYEKQQKYEN